MKYNAKNERIKREYYQFLKEAKGRSQATIDNVNKAINRFEKETNYLDFNKFNKNVAIAFKRKFSTQKSLKSGKLISKSTYTTTLRNLKEFFLWLRFKTGYKRIDIYHVEYLNPKESELKIARSRKIKKYPTLDQIQAVIASIKPISDVERRNRALIAFTLLTGMRDSAIASLKLKHIYLEKKLVTQIPDEVKTKFSKSINTFFFPVGDAIQTIVVEWIKHLKTRLLFGDNDPIFPRNKTIYNKDFTLNNKMVEPIHWASASQIRVIFRNSFKNACIRYYPPHSFRTTLALLGEQICQTPEQFKAWSQNLGHEQVMTTLMSYGQVDFRRQGEIIKNLSTTNKKSERELLEQILNKMENNSC